MTLNQTNICVVGGGGWGKNHIKVLDQLEMLAGIADVSAARRQSLANTYPNVEIFDSVQLAAQRGFDGFVLATPAHTHYELAKFLLEKGFHVLVEKPITLVAAEARDLCQIARKRGVNLMVGHVLLFHPAIRKIKELLVAGKIGKLQYLYSNRLNLGTVRTEENILWSFAPHDISILQYLIGKKPTSIDSRGGVFLQPEIHDTTMTLIRYPDNIVAHIFLSWLHPYKEHRFVVVGSKGMLSFEDSSKEKQLLFYEKGIDWINGEPKKREGPTEVIEYGHEMPLTEELRYFASHLDGTPIEVASGESGVEVLEILERATEDLVNSTLAPQADKHTPGEQNSNYFVHPTSIVDENVQIGESTKIWHFCHVQSGARIGKQSSLGQNVYVGASAIIGNYCKIQNNVSLYQGVELEDYVFCGPSMVFTNVRAPRSQFPKTDPSLFDQTLVGLGATLGANCTIVCGVKIGRHSFVAAGAVVTKDVPDFALVAGVPAKRISWNCECGQRLAEAAKMRCSACGIEYVRAADRVTQVVPRHEHIKSQRS